MSAQVLWMNIPLMVLAFGLWVGVPLWLVLRHPDQRTEENRSVPAYLAARQSAAHEEQRSRNRVRAHTGSRQLTAM